MKMRNRGGALPPSSSRPAPTAADEPAVVYRPGDFLLGRAGGYKHALIRFGQRMRIRGADRVYAGYTHAALVTSPNGELIEAVGGGVRRATVAQYVVAGEAYRIVHLTVSEEDRGQVVAFARHALADHAPYGGLTLVSVALWAFTGSRLVFFLDGSYTCSGLVAAALERTSATFDVNAARIMPAQLAAFFEASPPPEPTRPPRRTWVARLRCRGC